MAQGWLRIAADIFFRRTSDILTCPQQMPPLSRLFISRILVVHWQSDWMLKRKLIDMNICLCKHQREANNMFLQEQNITKSLGNPIMNVKQQSLCYQPKLSKCFGRYVLFQTGDSLKKSPNPRLASLAVRIATHLPTPWGMSAGRVRFNGRRKHDRWWIIIAWVADE